MSIIKAIYRGELSFRSSSPTTSTECNQWQKECDRLESLLKEHLSKEDYELFREFNKYTDYIMASTNEEKFEKGFLVGVKLQKELDKA